MSEPTLGEKLKQHGLDSGEAHARLAFEEVKQLCQIVVDDTENPWDDQALAVVLGFEKTVLEAIDKINGKVDQP